MHLFNRELRPRARSPSHLEFTRSSSVQALLAGVSQENIPRILPRGVAFHAFAERRRRASAVLFWLARSRTSGNSENCGLAYCWGRLGTPLELCPRELRTEQSEDTPNRHSAHVSPGSDEGFLKRLRLRQRMWAVYPLSLSAGNARGNDSRRFVRNAQLAGRSLRCRSRRYSP